MTTDERVLRLGDELIDLTDVHEPALVDIVRCPAVRRAATRALDELEARHNHAPWVAICTATSELIAASPSFDADDTPDWRSRLDAELPSVHDAPVAVLSLGANAEISEDDPAAVAAHWVERGLSEIVVAEQRAAVATMRAGRAETLATTDALTGLANQRAWWSRMGEENARIERTQRKDVIAIVDLDGLKSVNDELGHLHGDLLIRLTAMTLHNVVRACDVLARVGGDEFAVLAVDFDGTPSVLSDRITSALREADIQASVGVASPSPGMSLIEVYEQADRAMYADKRNRRGRAAAGT